MNGDRLFCARTYVIVLVIGLGSLVPEASRAMRADHAAPAQPEYARPPEPPTKQGNSAAFRLGVWTRLIPGGALITNVVPGSPADRAGLKTGDIIQLVEGDRVGIVGDQLRSLREPLARARETAKLTVLADRGPDRNKETLVVNVRLAPAPVRVAEEFSPRLGVSSRLVAGGALVTRIVKGSPADRAGLVVGDIIQLVDRYRVGIVGDQKRALGAGLQRAGEVAKLTVLAGSSQGGESLVLNIRLQ